MEDGKIITWQIEAIQQMGSCLGGGFLRLNGG